MSEQGDRVYRAVRMVEIFFVNGRQLTLYNPPVTADEVEQAILAGGVVRVPRVAGLPDIVINASAIAYVQDWPVS